MKQPIGGIILEIGNLRPAMLLAMLAGACVIAFAMHWTAPRYQLGPNTSALRVWRIDTLTGQVSLCRILGADEMINRSNPLAGADAGMVPHCGPWHD